MARRKTWPTEAARLEAMRLMKEYNKRLNYAAFPSFPRLLARRQARALAQEMDARIAAAAVDDRDEKIMIAMRVCRGNLTRAVEALGMGKGSVRRRVVAMGIERTLPVRGALVQADLLASLERHEWDLLAVAAEIGYSRSQIVRAMNRSGIYYRRRRVWQKKGPTTEGSSSGASAPAGDEEAGMGREIGDETGSACSADGGCQGIDREVGGAGELP
jgi:hypothetical protein